MRSAVVVIGGSPPPVGISSRLPTDAFVIGADSGYDHALALGRRPDLLVGDLDSISADGLADASTHGVTIDRFPVAKDATDTELALAAAIALGHDHIVVVGGAGDRLDHGLATLFVVAAPAYATARIELWWGSTWLGVVRDRLALSMEIGETFSVLPVHGDAAGVSIAGAVYPLVDHPLPAGTSLGTSNVAAAVSVTVEVARGAVVVIRPHVLGGTP